MFAPPMILRSSIVNISDGRFSLGIRLVLLSRDTLLDRLSLVRCTDGALSTSSVDSDVSTIRVVGLIGGGAGDVLGIVAIFSLSSLPCLADSAASVSVDVRLSITLDIRFLMYRNFIDCCISPFLYICVDDDVILVYQWRLFHHYLMRCYRRYQVLLPNICFSKLLNFVTR